jgi:hypothetical protein
MTSTTTCPAWCESLNCEGEHWKTQPYAEYVPAIGSWPETDEHGVKTIPSMGAGIRWDESRRRALEIVLHEQRGDVEYVFDLSDAFELIAMLLSTYVEATADVPTIPIPWTRNWDRFREDVDTLALRTVSNRVGKVEVDES